MGLEELLFPHERVLWAGKPERVRTFTWGDVPRVIVGCVVVGFGVIWTTGGSGEWFPILFGILFTVAALYVTLGGLLGRVLAFRRMSYAVTNQRVVIIQGGQIASVYLNQLPPPTLSERGDGTGTIGFGDYPDRPEAFALRGVPDARSLYDLIVRLQEGSA